MDAQELAEWRHIYLIESEDRPAGKGGKRRKRKGKAKKDTSTPSEATDGNGTPDN